MKPLLRAALLAVVILTFFGCSKTEETSTRGTSTPNVPATTPTTAATPRTDAVKNGWWIRVCTSQTQASGINLDIGLGGNDGSHRFWRKWSSNDPAEFDVPDEFRTVQEIWIKGSADPNGRNVHMCTYYRGDSTQKMTFDNNEEHETSQGDRDDCGC